MDFPVKIKAVIIKNNQLILKRVEKITEVYDLPGEVVRKYDDLKTLITHFVLDQTGLVIKPLKVIDATSLIHTDKAGNRIYEIIIYYETKIISGDLKKDIKLLSINDLWKHELYSGSKEVIKKITR